MQAEKAEMLKRRSIEEYVAMVMRPMLANGQTEAICAKLSEGRMVRITPPPSLLTDTELAQRKEELEHLGKHSLELQGSLLGQFAQAVVLFAGKDLVPF